MGERFVVVPVYTGKTFGKEEGRSGSTRAHPAPDTGGSRSSVPGTVAENEQLEDSVFEPTVPILEYNREPNKYGKTAGSDISPCPTSYLTLSPGD